MPICPFCHFERSDSVGCSSPLPCDISGTHTPCKACASVADIDAKIEKARRDLMEMQTERLRLLLEVNHAHDRLSERFPVEIISNIFQHCLSDLDTLSKSTDGRLASVPLRLSQVSRRWRTISHSIFQLWTTLPLYVKESQELSLGAICDVARDSLARSGRRNSLSIIMDIDDKVDPQAKNCLPIFTALKNYAGHVRHLQIRASSPILRQLCYLGGEMTTLRISCAAEWWPGYESYYHPRRGCNEVEPQHLYIDGASCANLHISLNRLTHLEVRQMPFSDAITILRDAPHLKSCNFARLLTDFREPSLPAEPFVKPTLKHLCLHECIDIDFPAFVLASFTFPSLQSLGLENKHSTPLTDVINHLIRSGPQLEELYLRGLSSDDLRHPSAMAELIGPITGHNLRHLEVIGNPGWDETEDCLQLTTIIEGASAYLGKLRTLRLYSSENGWVLALQKMLSAALAIVSATARALSIEFCVKKIPVPLEETQNLELHAIYNGYPPLTSIELREMMLTISHHLVSVAISYRRRPRVYSEDPTPPAQDLTEQILVTLARLLHKSRSKECMNTH